MPKKVATRGVPRIDREQCSAVSALLRLVAAVLIDEEMLAVGAEKRMEATRRWESSRRRLTPCRCEHAAQAQVTEEDPAAQAEAKRNAGQLAQQHRDKKEKGRSIAGL
jgi:hypothetical protein